jgi:hypothetical protein
MKSSLSSSSNAASASGWAYSMDTRLAAAPATDDGQAATDNRESDHTADAHTHRRRAGQWRPDAHRRRPSKLGLARWCCGNPSLLSPLFLVVLVFLVLFLVGRYLRRRPCSWTAPWPASCRRAWTQRRRPRAPPLRQPAEHRATRSNGMSPAALASVPSGVRISSSSSS